MFSNCLEGLDCVDTKKDSVNSYETTVDSSIDISLHFVDQQETRSYKMTVNEDTTIEALKAYVQAKQGVNSTQLSMWLLGNQKHNGTALFEDESTLMENGIVFGANVVCVVDGE